MPEEEQDISALLEEIKGLGETINGMNDQIAELQTKITPEPPVDPKDDPDNAPPKDWKTFREELDTRMETKAEEKLRQKEEVAQAEQAKMTEAEQELDKEFDRQAEKAIKEGFLPEIKDPKDPNDPGNRAQKDLFGYAAKVGSVEDLLQVVDVVSDYNKRGMHFVIPEGKEPKDGSWMRTEYQAPGKNVPIGSSSNRVATNVDGKLSYSQRHKMSMDQLARRAKQRYETE